MGYDLKYSGSRINQLLEKIDNLVVDSAVTAGSANPVSSNAVDSELEKQNTRIANKEKEIDNKFVEQDAKVDSKLTELESKTEILSVQLGETKELASFSSFQRRVYFYGNFQKGSVVKIQTSGDAEVVSATIVARYDDDTTNLALMSVNQSKEVVLEKDTSYILFILNENNITKEGSVFCRIDGIQDKIEDNTKAINNLLEQVNTNELNAFTFRGQLLNALQSNLQKGVYSIYPDAANLPSDYNTAYYSYLVCYNSTFRVLYSQENTVWWCYNSKDWVKLIDTKAIDNLKTAVNNIDEQINGRVIGSEELQGEEILYDKYIVKETNRVNIYANNNLAIAPYKIVKGRIYKVSVAKTTNAAGKVLCYASSLTSLEVVPITDAVGNRGAFEYTFTSDRDGYVFIGISADTSYVVVNEVIKSESIAADVTRLNQDVEELKKSSGNLDWSEKKWVVIGDSLSTINSTTTKRYIDYIVEKTGIKVEVLAVGGSSWGKPQLQNNAFFQQASRVASDVDIVTIFGSFNSWYLKDSDGAITDGPTSLGNIDSEDVSTRYGCMNTAIRNVYTNAPLARVGIIYPTPWKTANPYSPTDTTNSLMEMLDNVTKRWGIPKLDLFHSSGMRPWDDTYRLLAYSKDSGGVDGNPAGVHPDETGHKVIASLVLDFMKGLIL